MRQLPRHAQSAPFLLMREGSAAHAIKTDFRREDAWGPMSSETVDILIVDDEPRNLVALEAVLEGAGLRVVKARSGEEALRHLLSQQFALIILDIHMPGLDGFATAELIRGTERTRHIPIIFLTANADVERVSHGYAHGAVDYLFKPVVAEVLRAKVSVFVELHRKTAQLLTMERRENERRLEEERSRWEGEALRARLERERAAAESLAAANERLEKALEETRRALGVRDEFLRIASHELRTPLTSMQLVLDNAARRAGTDRLSPEQVGRTLRIIDGQVNRLGTLIEELLSAVTLESGGMQLHPAEVDLAGAARSAVDEMEPVFAAARCPVIVHAPDVAIVGRWDGFWIRQAIGNLLTNATKFGAGAPIEVMVASDPISATLAVRDQGIGIAPADQERIFAPFERAVSADHYGGLGLGLHIVRKVVSAHGGSVRVESQPGAGATFTVSLPRQFDGDLPQL
jgi:signal transduction histidine kinase